MIKVKRIGHATFTTPDLVRQIEYYQNVVGLTLVARSGDTAFLATNSGQLAIVLKSGATEACTKIGFEVSPAVGLSDISRQLSAMGIKSSISTEAAPGISDALTLTDPKGTDIELFSSWTFLPRGPDVGGAVTIKLGHLAFAVPDPAKIVEFYEAVLGFRTSDWIGDSFAFLRCNVDHHTVNFIRSPKARMHHIAFEMRDAAHLHNTCDLLGQKHIQLLWGPVRHGPGHNVATYHNNPDGQMVEFFAELDRMIDEESGYFDPKPWHRDRPQKPKVWNPDLQRDMWGLPPSLGFLSHAK